MKKRIINIQVLAEAFCFAVLGSAFLYVACNGKYLSYVTPRTKPYLFFAAFMMLLWFLTCLPRLFLLQHRKRSAHCLVLLIPFVCLIIPHNANAAAGLSKGLVTTAASGTVAVAPKEEVIRPEELPRPRAADGYISTAATGKPTELHGYDPFGKTIRVSDQEFYGWSCEIFANPKIFEGYEVTMTGFVFRDAETMTDNEFVPARYLMTCCVADLAPCGLICMYEGTADLKEGDWYTVTGTIAMREYQNVQEPRLQVSALTGATAVSEFLYPY